MFRVWAPSLGASEGVFTARFLRRLRFREGFSFSFFGGFFFFLGGGGGVFGLRVVAEFKG